MTLIMQLLQLAQWRYCTIPQLKLQSLRPTPKIQVPIALHLPPIWCCRSAKLCLVSIYRENMQLSASLKNYIYNDSAYILH